MWISRKKLKEELEKSFNEGRYKALLDEEHQERSYWIARNTAIVHAVLPELKELKNNTWDKERIDRIIRILMQGLA